MTFISALLNGNGEIRYNSINDQIEMFDGKEWKVVVGTGIGASPYLTTTLGGGSDRVVASTASSTPSTLTFPSIPGAVSYSAYANNSSVDENPSDDDIPAPNYYTFSEDDFNG